MNRPTVPDEFLAPWRRQVDAAGSPARDRARQALLAEVARARDEGALRVRRPHWRHRIAIGLAAGAMASLVGAGWNAPPGSALHFVRTSRQAVALSLPGANPAALHLQYAEQDLADARAGRNRAASLDEARRQLDAAHAVLPVDHASPLWTQWTTDESELAGEQDAESGSPAGAASGPTPAATPRAPETARPDGGDPAATAAASTAPAETASGEPVETAQPPAVATPGYGSTEPASP